MKAGQSDGWKGVFSSDKKFTNALQGFFSDKESRFAIDKLCILISKINPFIMLNANELLTELKAELDEAEQKRLHHYKRVRPFRIIFNLIGLFTLVAIVYAIYDTENGGGILGWAWGLFMVMLVVYGIKYDFDKGQFKDYLQHRVISKIIPKLGPGFSYLSRGGFPVQHLIDSRLFSTFSTSTSEDFVTGKLNGRTISFAETKLEWRSGSSDSKPQTVFNGIYAEIKLTAQFASSCWLLPKKKKIKNASVVNLGEPENQLLNKYRLYAEHDEFATQLFTEDVLKRILKVNEDLRSRKVISGHIRFAFIGNTIRMAFRPRHKFLEPDLLKPVNTEAFLQKELALLNECARLTEIV